MNYFKKIIIFIKNIFNKKDKKKDILNFDISIFKDIEYFNIKPTIINYDTVFIFFIKNNIDILLKNIVNKFKTFCKDIVIGVEIEFYLDNINNNEILYKNIKEFCTKNNIDILGIETERGQGQYEIKLNKYNDIYKLINDYNLLKSYLKENFNANFSTYYKNNEPFSALQININLLDKNNKNLFARCIDEYGNKDESEIMIYSINGILKTTNFLLPLYIKDRHCVKRFDYEINEKIYKNGNIPAPTFISWGVNNRTATIRIPTPTDFKNYEEIDNNSRRIEFRVPSSDADIKFCIFGILSSMLYGIENKLNIYEKNNFNVLINNNLEKIELKRFGLDNDDLFDFVNILTCLI